jgi:signal transduction histidine kinase
VTSLTRQLAVPFLAFVVAGSISLVFWIYSEELRESRRQFVAMADANARFIREAQLPRSERTSAGLRQALGVDVYVFTPLANPADTGALRVWPGPGEWKLLPDGREAVAAVVSGDERLVLARPRRRFAFMSDRARLFAALLGFWSLSLALAWVLARRIVHPLRTLAEKLPHIADEATSVALPEAGRRDEIGQLARAYTETRAQLTSERAARTQAERLATLGKMATGLAHEINNPVAAIRLHAQLLEEEVPAEQRERVATILGESSRIESLVSQWMFLARPQPPSVSSCDLAEVVAAVLRALQPAAAHAGVTIRNETPAGLVANGDRRRLSQAVTNILMNAIHAAAGGQVVIAGGEVETVSSRSKSEPSGGTPLPPQRHLELTISDSGPGFSSAALEHGSELFFSEKEGGMGVGLSVSAEILRAHGGELRLANKPGGGAIVTLVLPALPGM